MNYDEDDEGPQPGGLNLHQLLVTAVERKAEALHVTTGAPPWLKLGGELVPLKTAPLTPMLARQLVYSVLTDTQKSQLEQLGEGALSFSFGVKGLGRFLTSAFFQRGACAATIKPIPFQPPEAPPWFGPARPWVEQRARLSVVAGPRGSGRSAILGAWVDHLNSNHAWNLLSIEAPIAYLHPHKRSVVNQVDVGVDLTLEQAERVARESACDLVAVDLPGDALRTAAKLLGAGCGVVASLDAPTLECAAESIQGALGPAQRRLVQGLVWLDAPGAGKTVDGRALETLLG